MTNYKVLRFVLPVDVLILLVNIVAMIQKFEWVNLVLSVLLLAAMIFAWRTMLKAKKQITKDVKERLTGG